MLEAVQYPSPASMLWNLSQSHLTQIARLIAVHQTMAEGCNGRGYLSAP